MDEPKTDKVVEIQEDKQSSPEDLGELQSDKMMIMMMILCQTHFLLQNPKNQKHREPKKTKTKKTHKHKKWTDMPELISSDKETNKETITEEATPQIIIHSYLPLPMMV